MGTLLDLASLVVVPSGYKEDIIYSVKPTDGTGDLSFTRSLDTATRVGPDGLIEKVRTNLLLHSQDPSNAVWTKANTTYSGDTLTAVGGLNSKYLFQAQAQQGLQTIYFDVAYVSHQFIQVFHVSGAGDVQFANFDIQNKVLGTSGGGALNATIQDFGTFLRIALVLSTTTKTTCALAFVDSASAARGASSASTGSVKVFNAQNETGDIATPYIPTTTAAVSVGMLANVPRLDYLGGGCPKLLLEPQRTNLLTFSEQFNNAAWTKNTATIVANVATSPAGFLDADRLVPDNGSGGDARQTLSHTTGSALTISYFVKKESSLNLVGITILGNASVSFNLDTNAFATLALLNGWTLGNTSFDDYGNGWKRVKVTFVAGTTGSSVTRVVEVRSTGDGTQGVLFYGCQAEAGSYATSYIPTLAAAVTRSADLASKTGISALIGQTEGTIYWEVQKGAIPSNSRFQLNDGTSNNWLFVSVEESSRLIRMYAGVFAGTTVDITSVATLNNDAHKIAFAYAQNDFQVYVDGVAFLSHTSGDIPACSRLDLGSNSPTGAVLATSNTSQALLFKTRLTNTQLEELTTP